MFKLLREVPTYAYLAIGVVGATATYLFYDPANKYSINSSLENKNSTKRSLVLQPRGLINHRNECFINVILQSLASSQKVVEWLVFNKLQSNSCLLFDTLSKIISLINRLEMTNIDVDFSDFNISQDHLDFYAANHIKKALNQHDWHIRPSDEHDCHEFFHLLMDVLDDELSQVNKSNKSLNFFQPSNNMNNNNSSSNNNTNNMVSMKRNKNPFHGYLVSQFECLDCAYKYPLRVESFYSLSLMIPTQKQISHVTTLYECINNYFKPEHLAEMKCENCNKNNSGMNSNVKKKGFIKKQAIAKLPECLCIQIQRNSWSDSSYGMIKQTSHVRFPLNIKIDDDSSIYRASTLSTNFENSTKSKNILFKNLATYQSPSTFSLKQVGLGGLLGGNRILSNKNESLNTRSQINLSSYALRSAVVHYGNAHSGHFVVYRKNSINQNEQNVGVNQQQPQQSTQDPNWYMISDNDIKLITENNLLNSNVYMLFYDRITHEI